MGQVDVNKHRNILKATVEVQFTLQSHAKHGYRGVRKGITEKTFQLESFH